MEIFVRSFYLKLIFEHLADSVVMIFFSSCDNYHIYEKFYQSINSAEEKEKSILYIISSSLCTVLLLQTDEQANLST